MIDVRRLRLLRELATRGTVTATAEALHLSGPAVSQQLAVLEREAGIALLEKRGRTLSLTPAGHRLVAHADVILGNIATAESDLATLRHAGRNGGALGTVRIAAFPSAARVLVSRLWSHQELPTLRLVEQEPEFSVQALVNRDVDVAVVHDYTLLPRELPGACEVLPLLREPVLLAVPPNLAADRGLAPGDAAALARFADVDWLVPGQETSCHEMVRRACGAAGFVVRPIVEATDFSVLTALVAAGAGVALIPRMALPPALSGVSLHPLEQPVSRSISALTRPGEHLHPAVLQVLGRLEHEAAQQ